jgi:hypothetical protein
VGPLLFLREVLREVFVIFIPKTRTFNADILTVVNTYGSKYFNTFAL